MIKFILLFLVVASQAVLQTSVAEAVTTIDEPHYSATSNGTCITCHINQLDLGNTGYNNLCITCHRPGDPAAGTRPFTPGDAADPFKSYTSASKNYSKNYQTSHRWDGTDTVPAAGAQPPIQGQLTSSNLRGRTSQQLACVRCHNQHSNSYGNFLRAANDRDQICLDCHRSRNVQSHLQGSHPVNINYNTAPGKFNKPALNANNANPTSDLNVQLAKTGGTVLCSTCHGLHYSDSRSGTVDGSAGFANLSSSDGSLLRTDRRGAAVASGQADNINICTNCHAGKRNHNQKGQDVQCNDCHGAHVEYDPNDPSGSKGTNLFLVRRSVPKGTSGSGTIFFRYSGNATKEYANNSGTGVCQGCHAVPAPGGIYPQAHAGTDPRTCSGCHNHNNSSGSFSASGSCNGCHGYPPVNDMTGLGVAGNFENARPGDYPNGGGHHSTHLLPTVTISEGFTPCLPCHPSSSHNQGGGTVVQTNVNVNVPADTAYRFDDNRTKRYNSTTRSCSNISCHFQPSAAW